MDQTDISVRISGRRVQPQTMATIAARLLRRIYRNGQLDRHARGDASTYRAELVNAAVIAKNGVGRETHLAQVPHALAVTIGRVDRRTGSLGKRDLRGRDLVRRIRRQGQARIDLEVDVGPTARVAGRADRRCPRMARPGAGLRM
jgi:hypothetical protein